MTEPKIPQTISDEQMRNLQERARKANPHLDRLTDPDAIRRRIQTREQSRNAKWS
jgi:hypothetical protein